MKEKDAKELNKPQRIITVLCHVETELQVVG